VLGVETVDSWHREKEAVECRKDAAECIETVYAGHVERVRLLSVEIDAAECRNR
jgi:hypothetical protein